MEEYATMKRARRSKLVSKNKQGHISGDLSRGDILLKKLEFSQTSYFFLVEAATRTQPGLLQPNSTWV